MSNNTVSLDQRSMQSLERLMTKHSDDLHHMLKNTLSGIGKSGFGGSGLSGVRQGTSIEDTLKELKSFHKALNRAGEALSATEKYQRAAASREINTITDLIKTQEQEKKKREDNTEAIEDNTEATEKQAKRVEEANRRIADMATRAAQGALSFEAATRAVNEFSQAYKHGLSWNAIGDTITAAFKMGMSPKEMMDFQAQFRRVSNTFSGGIKEFDASVAANQKEWLRYTGSLKDAAQAQAEFADIALSMGVDRKDMGTAVDGLFKQFKQLQVITSQTAEDFAQMQRSMLSDQNIREKLVGLQGKERINALAGLTQTNIAFQQMGMTKEIAQATIAFIEGQGSRKAVDRLRESYQVQNIGVWAGVDPEKMRQFGELDRLGQRRSAKQNTDYALLAQEFYQKFQAKKMSGAVDEIIANKFEENPLVQSLKSLSEGILQTTGAGASDTAIAKQTESMNSNSDKNFQSVVGAIISFSNVFGAWGQSALAAITGLAVGIAAKRGLFDVLKPGGKAPAGGGAGGAGGKGFGISGTGKAFGIGGALIGGGMLASSMMSDTNPAKDYVGNMTSFGGTGAMIGSIFGPLGMAIGGVAGGLAGGLYTMLSNSEKLNNTLDTQKTAMVKQYSAVKAQSDFEIASYQKEMDSIEAARKANGSLREEEIKRLEDLKRMQEKAREDGLKGNAASGAAKMQFNAMAIAQASKGIFDAASGEKTGLRLLAKYGDTNDVVSALEGVRQNMLAAGANVDETTLRQMMASRMQEAFSKRGMASSEEAMLTANGIEGLRGNYDFDNKTMNPIIAEALQSMAPDLNRMMTTQFTETIKQNLTPELASQLTTQLKDTQAKLAQELATAEAYKNSDDSSVQGLGVEAEARAAQTQETARILEQALRSAAPTEMSIKGLEPEKFSEMVDLLEIIANGGKKKVPFRNTASSQ